MSIDHLVKDFAIYDNSLSHEQETKRDLQSRSNSKYFRPVQIFAKQEQHAEAIIKTGLLYRLEGKNKKKKFKQIVSITNEPRILIYNPLNNKFQVLFYLYINQ